MSKYFNIKMEQLKKVVSGQWPVVKAKPWNENFFEKTFIINVFN